ncbi:hypothetical protein HYS94_00380 [Candidatus Daviesbacteria bacterium]|nr:hypothetical protein [Candidatus Daviesbacteria bacterium]
MPKFLSNQQGVIPLILVAVVGAISASGVTVAASQKSLPGDALYPVKKVTENVRVATAFSKQGKAKVHIAIAEEKVKEIEKLEEKGKTDQIAEAAQGLEDSQDQALELTQDVREEGGNVNELVERLEVQTKLQQIVFTKISPKISVQIRDNLRKSLESFRKDLEVVVESVEEDEPVDSDEEEENPDQTPCPEPTSSDKESEEEDGYYEDEDYDNDQEEEDTSSEEDRENYWDYKYLEDDYDYEYEDVQGVSQLRNSQSSSFGRDPCDSAESRSGAGSQTFDGGAGTGEFEDSAPESLNDQGSPNQEPTITSPEVEGVSKTGSLLQLILNALFPPQR